jgi:hypothetical protein
VRKPNGWRRRSTRRSWTLCLYVVLLSSSVSNSYDFDTRAISKLLKGHTKPVVAVSWSRSSRSLLSASLDGLIIRWDVLAGAPAAYMTVSTLAPPAADPEATSAGIRKLKSVMLHPTVRDLAILNFQDEDYPLLVQLRPVDEKQQAETDSSEDAMMIDGPAPSLPVGSIAAATAALREAVAGNVAGVPELPPRAPIFARHITAPYAVVPSPAAAATAPGPSPPAEEKENAQEGQQQQQVQQQISLDPNDPTHFYSRFQSTAAIFDRAGAFVIEANNKGSILVYELQWDETQRQAQAAAAQNTATALSVLPAYCSIRLLHIEGQSWVQRGRNDRRPIAPIHSLVHSPCRRYLLSSASSTIKLFDVAAALQDPFGNPSSRAQLDTAAELYANNAELRHAAVNGAPLPDMEERRQILAEREKRQRARQREEKRKKTMSSRKKAASSKPGADSKEANEEMETDKPSGDQPSEATSSILAPSPPVTDSALPNANDGEKNAPSSSPAGPRKRSRSRGGANNASDGEDADEMETKEEQPVSQVGQTQENPPLLRYMNTFSDQVNRMPWRKATFLGSSTARVGGGTSGGGGGGGAVSHHGFGCDFIVAGSAERGEHRIHIWSIMTGNLVKILQGLTEGLLDLAAHPRKPALLTCCTSGAIYIWNKAYAENWSAFAPDFEELDDNQE